MGRIRLLTIVLLILTIADIAPCGADQSKESTLTERVKSYWELQVKDDWPGRYDFTSPAEREKRTREQFVEERKNAPLQYVSYNLGKMEISGAVAWAEVSFEAQVKIAPGSPSKKVTIWQPWKKQEDGQWSVLSPEEAEQEPKLPPSLRQTPDIAALTKRADELWKAKENERLNIVYEFCEPKFKAQTSMDEFVGKKALWAYHSHTLEWAETTGDSGKVKVTSVCKPTDPHVSKLAPQEKSSIEKWVKVDGVWYLAVAGMQ
jgi:hypothetical protein